MIHFQPSASQPQFVRILLLFSLSLTTVLYATAQEKPEVCGTRTDSPPEQVVRRMQDLPDIMKAKAARKESEELLICRIAVEIDSDTYMQFDKDTASIIQSVLENIEKSSEFFDREFNIRLIVSDIKIWKDYEQDPYRGTTNIYSLIYLAEGIKPVTRNFDKRVYLYTKNVTGAAGIAFLGGSINVSPLLDPKTISHELGHNLGSPHTHDCFWTGGPIDYCSDITGSCYDKALEFDFDGTFMSYCNGSNQVDPQVRALIRNFAEISLSKIDSAPSRIAVVKDAVVRRGDFISWPVASLAGSYQLELSSNADFLNSVVEKTPVNGFSTIQLAQGREYFTRIKAVNSFGSSDWSNVFKIMTDAGRLEAPNIHFPSDHAIVEGRKPVELSFSPVPGATNYLLQWVPYVFLPSIFSDINRVNLYENKYSFTTYPGCMAWRVRAERGEEKGPWSQMAFFSANLAPDFNLRLPVSSDFKNVPRTLPFTYQSVSYGANVRISISDKPDFSSTVFQKRYQMFTGEMTDVIENLPANRDLYFRMEESSSNRPEWDGKNFINHTFPFSTSDKLIPSQLTVLSKLNQEIFGRANINIALATDHVWMEGTGEGFVRMNIEDLKYEIFNRTNTAGLLGANMVVPGLQSSSKGDIYILNRAAGGLRKVRLPNGDPGAIPEIKFSYLLGQYRFDGESGLYWNANEILKEQVDPSQVAVSLSTIKRLSSDVSIQQVRVYNDKVWANVLSYTTGNYEIISFDINNPDNTEKFSYLTEQTLKPQIGQIEIGSDGKVWVRQTDAVTQKTSIVVNDGSKWDRFDGPVGYTIAALALSSEGKPYILCSGKETQIFKLNNQTWEKIGVAIPYQDFGKALWVDKNEDFWISGAYGLAKLRTSSSVEGSVKSEIGVFPNPVADKITIKFEERLMGGQQFSIANVKGIVMGTYYANKQVNAWDIHHFPTGIYVVWTIYKGEKLSWKILKQ